MDKKQTLNRTSKVMQPLILTAIVASTISLCHASDNSNGWAYQNYLNAQPAIRRQKRELEDLEERQDKLEKQYKEDKEESDYQEFKRKLEDNE